MTTEGLSQSVNLAYLSCTSSRCRATARVFKRLPHRNVGLFAPYVARNGRSMWRDMVVWMLCGDMVMDALPMAA